jgi:hypothetical protein
MTPTEAARRVCPNWMSPEGDAHFRDVLKALEDQRRQGALDEAKKAVDATKQPDTVPPQ